MNRMQFSIALVVVAISGLLGGALSDRMRDRSAHAQEDAGPMAVDQLVVDDLVARTILVYEEEDDPQTLIQGGSVALVTSDKVRAALRLGTDGSPAVELVDEAGKARAEMTLRAPNGTGEIALNGQDGAAVAELTEAPQSGSVLDLLDSVGRTRLLVGSDSNGVWGIDLREADGQVRWASP